MIVSRNTGDLPSVAARLLNVYNDQQIFAFHGSMGAGKTTLIKAFCDVLDVIDVVVSPTFTIVNEYETRQGLPVYHLDLYRVNSIREAVDAGVEEYLFSGHVCLIEWPEKIEKLLPDNYVYIYIQMDPENNRREIMHKPV